jgi:hypothetical protein
VTSNDEEIPRDVWQATLEALTVQHEGDLSVIEVADVDLGDQFEVEHIPFSYIEYDLHDDAVSIGVGGLDGRYPVMLRHVISIRRTFSFTLQELAQLRLKCVHLTELRHSSRFSPYPNCQP